VVSRSIKWTLPSNGQFSTAFLYDLYAFAGVIDIRMEELWQARIPLKIKNFFWLIFKKRLQTTDNLKAKN
jgi:hypothetical protein